MKRLLSIYQNNQQAPVALLDQALVSSANFVSGVLLARFLGLKEYGIFAMAWLVVLFFGSIQQSFIIAPMQTMVPKRDSEERARLRTSLFLIQLSMGLAAMALTWGFCHLSETLFFDQTPLDGLTVVLPVAVFSFLMNEYFRKLFFSESRQFTALVLDIISYGTQLAGLFLVASYGELDLRRGLIIIALSNSISTVYGLLRSKGLSADFRHFLPHLREVWTYSGWLIGTSLLQWCSGNFFIITAGGLLGPAPVGAIRMAQNVVGVLNILFLAMENFIPSNAARIYHEHGLRYLYTYLRQVMLLAGVATLAALSMIVVFSREIITMLYGSGFEQYDSVLLGFSIVYAFVFTGLPLRYFIRTVEKNRDIFVSYVLSAGTSLLLAGPIVSSYGITGVVIGLVLAQVIVQLWFLYSLRPEISRLWKSSI
jgi:O-antigen/teichoic acid export membrane protein